MNSLCRHIIGLWLRAYDFGILESVQLCAYRQRWGLGLEIGTRVQPRIRVATLGLATRKKMTSVLTYIFAHET